MVAAAGTWVAGHASAVTAASLAAIVLLATLARTWHLSEVGLGGDEAVYAGQSALLADAPGMERWFIPASRGNSNFLATQWIVSLVYRLFGVSELGARLVSAVASILTILLVYLIARELRYRRSEALFATLVIGASGYAIMLGRLALLDATACFVITAAMFFLARWHRTAQYLWLTLFVVATALAIEVKVTGAIILPIALVFVLLTGGWRRLTPWGVLALFPIGLVALTPALVQVLSNSGGLLGYFSASTQRTSGVPWHYYLGLLWSAEGALLSVLLLLGVVVALIRREPHDVMPLIWFGCVAVFLQFYPLKGFNYLLPALPPLALLAGRALDLAVRRLPGTLRSRRVVVLPVVATVLVASQLGAARAVVANDRSAGMREAAEWLKAHGAERAGALALSHGSGQYVLSFYGGVDSYPYGRFRIATVVPGGRVVKTTPRRDGDVPLDWIDYWPPRLIDEGRVSYLVYQTRPLDDPPEQSQVAGTVTEKQFRSLIARYGGRLVHRVYWNHEARVYVYKVTKRLPQPVITARPLGAFSRDGTANTPVSSPGAVRQSVALQADGFTFGSPLTVTYHGRLIGRAVADAAGRATLRVWVPISGLSQYHLIVSDDAGNHVSATGVSATKLTYRVVHGVVRVSGSGFKSSGAVVVYYREKRVGVTHARSNGLISLSFRLPANTHPRFRIMAAGEGGRAAFATGLSTPTLSFVSKDQVARLTGRDFSASTNVSLILGNRIVGVARADDTGTFHYRLRLPKSTIAVSRLTATDPIGRQATVTGLVHP
jgi:4-amino-4-deoxy-L-arabinose transferase-like glycosyltransferase